MVVYIEKRTFQLMFANGAKPAASKPATPELLVGMTSSLS